MSTITLFDAVHVSNDQRPALATEDQYEYLSWSGRPEIAAVRSCLEGWFIEYPDDAKAMLAARFRGAELRSALFELYVFTLLKKQGHNPEVVEPSPQRSTQRLPDFRIQRSGGGSLFIEATTIDCDPGLSKMDRDLAPLKAALDQMAIPHRFSIKVEKAATTPLAFAKLQKGIDAWFGSPSFQLRRSSALGEGVDSIDEEIACGDWVIEVTAYVSGSFGTPPRAGESPIVLWGTGVRFLDSMERLKKGLKRKADHYDVDGPVVLAVSPLGLGIDRDDVEAALYGPTWQSLKHDGSSTIVRKGEGLWFKPNRGPKNSSFPAVLICEDVHPTTVGCPDPFVYHAPESPFPVQGLLSRATHARLNGISVVYANGARGCDLLGIPTGWPHV
jgi:hypothetical protein